MMIISNLSLLKKILLLFLVIVGIYFAKQFLMPICIGGILATMFIPLCNWLEKRRFHKALAAFISLLMLLFVFGILVSLISWKIAELLNDISILKQKAIEIWNNTQEYIFNHLGVSVEKQSQILKAEQPSIGNIVQIVASSLTTLLANIIFVIAYFFFLLYSRAHIKAFFIKLIEPSQRSEMEKIVSSATKVSQQYLLGLSKMIVCLWIMYGIGFSLLGVENAIFFAILCGLLEIVPFIGNITGTTLTALISALHGADFSIILGIVITYFVIQFIQGWVLEPLILGPQVKINPLFTIIALVLGEILWGIPGIILAIPMTAIIKIICDHIEQLKPYGFLIGEPETEKNENSIVKKIKATLQINK
ncbi:MAG: AI-2E family transporter [Bacteroidota bacterium]